MAALGAMADTLAFGLDRSELQAAMPAGAARNALDCAFWDLEAKRAGKPVHVLAGLPAPRPLVTAYTISLGNAGSRWPKPPRRLRRDRSSRSSSAAPAIRRGSRRCAALAPQDRS